MLSLVPITLSLQVHWSQEGEMKVLGPSAQDGQLSSGGQLSMSTGTWVREEKRIK